MPVQVKRLVDDATFTEHLRQLGIELPLLGAPAAAEHLRAPRVVGGRTVGNRLCVLPMEGWDATPDGRPTELVARRWERFGTSGAKLVWGGEAVAVLPEARANPRQLTIGPTSIADLGTLRDRLERSHAAATGGTDGLVGCFMRSIIP